MKTVITTRTTTTTTPSPCKMMAPPPPPPSNLRRRNSSPALLSPLGCPTLVRMCLQQQQQQQQQQRHNPYVGVFRHSPPISSLLSLSSSSSSSDSRSHRRSNSSSRVSCASRCIMSNRDRMTLMILKECLTNSSKRTMTEKTAAKAMTTTQATQSKFSHHAYYTTEAAQVKNSLRETSSSFRRTTPSPSTSEVFQIVLETLAAETSTTRTTTNSSYTSTEKNYITTTKTLDCPLIPKTPFVDGHLRGGSPADDNWSSLLFALPIRRMVGWFLTPFSPEAVIHQQRQRHLKAVPEFDHYRRSSHRQDSDSDSSDDRHQDNHHHRGYSNSDHDSCESSVCSSLSDDYDDDDDDDSDHEGDNYDEAARRQRRRQNSIERDPTADLPNTALSLAQLQSSLVLSSQAEAYYAHTLVTSHYSNNYYYETNHNSSSHDGSSSKQNRDQQQQQQGMQLPPTAIATSSSNSDNRMDYTITQMDVIRIMRNASRHLDVESIFQLPVITYSTKKKNSKNINKINNTRLSKVPEEEEQQQQQQGNGAVPQKQQDQEEAKHEQPADDHPPVIETRTMSYDSAESATAADNYDSSWMLIDDDQPDAGCLIVPGAPQDDDYSSDRKNINNDQEEEECKQDQDAVGHNIEGNVEDELCVICLEQFQEGDRLRVLPCNHSFHLGCIDRWLSGSHSFDDCVTTGCPTCKKRAVREEEEEEERRHHDHFYYSNNNVSSSLSNHHDYADPTVTAMDVGSSVPSWAFARIGDALLARNYLTGA